MSLGRILDLDFRIGFEEIKGTGIEQGHCNSEKRSGDEDQRVQTRKVPGKVLKDQFETFFGNEMATSWSWVGKSGRGSGSGFGACGCGLFRCCSCCCSKI